MRPMRHNWGTNCELYNYLLLFLTLIWLKFWNCFDSFESSSRDQEFRASTASCACAHAPRRAVRRCSSRGFALGQQLGITAVWVWLRLCSFISTTLLCSARARLCVHKPSSQVIRDRCNQMHNVLSYNHSLLLRFQDLRPVFRASL